MTEPHEHDAQILRKIADEIARGLDNSRSPANSIGAVAAHPLAALAHEIKTPLSAIAAAAEIMRDERFGPLGDERYRGYAAGIHDSAAHALGVINAMMGLVPEGHAGRPEDGDRRVRERPDGVAFAEIDLNAVCERTAVSVRPLLEASGLRIEHRLAPGLPHVVADPVTVRQILLNLVTNAMRATPAGGAILIATEYDLAGPVHVAVTDTGSGMTQDDIARVLNPGLDQNFEPQPSGGLGLGFPLILRLAAINGAYLKIESNPERRKGTAVRLSFAADRVIPV